MLAASRLILVSILAPSWSHFDQDRTNVRDQQVSQNRSCVRLLSVGIRSIFRRDALPHPFIGWAYLHLDFQRGSRAFTCRVVGTIRPVLGV
mgnify:CR=1 FL=1